MDCILVTCLFDVKSRGDDKGRRSINIYKNLLQYLLDLNLPLFIYTDINLNINKDNIHIINKNIEDLSTYKFIKSSGNLDLKYPGNAKPPDIYYYSIINSKLDLLKETKEYLDQTQIYSDKKHLIWIDSGIAHVGTIPRERFMDDIKLHIYEDKITLVMMVGTSSQEISNLREYLSVNRGKIAAGLMIIPIKMIEEFQLQLEQLNKKIITDYNLLCIEEQLISVLTVTHGSQFEYIFTDYWMLSNLRYITNRISTVIMNLEHCRSQGMVDLGYKILLKLLDSISYGRCTCIPYEVFTILYNGQIISFYKDRDLSKKLGLFLGCLYYNRSDAYTWIKQRFDNIKSNISFLGLDLSDSTQFEEEYVYSLDDTHILWAAM